MLLSIGQPSYDNTPAPLMPQPYPPLQQLPAVAAFPSSTTAAGALSVQQPSIMQQGPNVFQRFTDRVAELGLSLPELYNRYDVGRQGQLTQAQVGPS